MKEIYISKNKSVLQINGKYILKDKYGLVGQYFNTLEELKKYYKIRKGIE